MAKDNPKGLPVKRCWRVTDKKVHDAHTNTEGGQGLFWCPGLKKS